MNFTKKVKKSIRSKLYTIFFIIIGVSISTMTYQYFQIEWYDTQVRKQKNSKDFLLIKDLITEMFDYLDNTYENESSELTNKTNTLYNLLLDDSFSSLKKDLASAKALIFSSLDHAAFGLERLALDGTIIDSTRSSMSQDMTTKAWMEGIFQMVLNDPGKIYVSPPLLDLETQILRIHAIALAPDHSEFIMVSHSLALPDTISKKVSSVEASFPDLIELQILLVDLDKRNIIDMGPKRATVRDDYEQFVERMRSLYGRCTEAKESVHAISDKKLFEKLDEEEYIVDPQEKFDTFYTLDHGRYAMFDENVLLIKAYLKKEIGDSTRSIQSTVIYSFMLIIVIILYFYYIIRRDVIIPLERITEATLKKVPVTDDSILNTHNEISSLAKSINNLNHRLSRQLKIKSRLLENQKTFISNTIHEVSTPLNVIGLNVDLLEMQYGRSDPIKFIVSGLRQIRSIKDDISYVMLAEDMEYTVQEIELCSFLQERIEFFNQMAWANDKSIVGRCDQNTILKISVTELSLLINNNISNAIKYSTGDEEIKIEAVLMERSVRLSFSNAGKAIINTKRIFQRFYREDNERRGFGIGLNIVYNICQKNHILCEARSEAGRNTFTYQIPLEDRDEDITA